MRAIASLPPFATGDTATGLPVVQGKISGGLTVNKRAMRRTLLILCIVIANFFGFFILTSPTIFAINGFRMVKDMPIYSTAGGSRWGLEKVVFVNGRTWWLRYHIAVVNGVGYLNP